MNTEDFRELYVKLVESYGIDPETAKKLLQRIIEILRENGGGKQEP